MIEVFDEKDIEECLSEVKDSNIKTYAFWLLDWAVQKRKIQAIPLNKVEQAIEKIEKLRDEEIIIDQCSEAPMEQYITEVGEGLELALDVLDELIREVEE